MLGMIVSERAAELFGRSPPVDVHKRNIIYLKRAVIRFIAEQGHEVSSELVKVNCDYLDKKKSLEDKINIANDIWAGEVLNNDEDAHVTMKTIRRYELDRASLNSEFDRVSKAHIVKLAEFYVEKDNELCEPGQVALVGLVPGDDDLEAQAFVKLMNYLVVDAEYQEQADEPMPNLDLPPPYEPPGPVVPQSARRPMAEVVDIGSEEDEPEVPLPLRLDARVVDEKQENDDHFLTDVRSCRRRILKGRGAKTYADDQGVIRLNTRTVEDHLSRRARAKKYPADAGLVKLLTIFKGRIEDRIEADYGACCFAVSFT